MSIKRLRSSQQNRRARGNTLVEYGMIGSTITVLSIAAFLTMGGRLNDIFANLKGDMAYHISLVGQAKAATVSPTSAPADAQHQQAYFPGAKVCYSNGICLNMDALSHQSTVAATTGANGSQELIKEQADLVQSIADQLANDPNADPTLIDLVTRLALAGHTIGNNLDQSVATLNDPAAFFNTYDAFWRSVMPYNDLKDQLNSYLAANPAALSPDMQQAIQGAVDATNAKAGTLVGAEGPNYDGWNAIDPNANAGGTINDDANTTCQNGGDTSVCVQ